MDKLFDETWQPKSTLPAQFPSFFYTRRVGDTGREEYVKSEKRLEDLGIEYKSEQLSYGVGDRNDPRPTPQRRGWAKRNGQIQRWWHGENVNLLPFKSKPLAASIGCTVAELNALPVNPRACDVVFDALSRSQAGITEAEFADERRASWQLADGSFDEAAFEADLWEARWTVGKAYLLFPGLPFIISNLVFYSPKVNGLQLLQDFADKNAVMVQKNAELWGEAFQVFR